jgi:hypothetical protein
MEIDIHAAHPARVHNYLAGGDAHFAADRAAIEGAVGMLPGGLAAARRAVEAMAGFMARAVEHLVVDAGIRQFVKLGAAVPASRDIHEIAQANAPGTRVVYVGSDPTVLAHAHSLRRSRPEGVTAYVHGDVRDVDAIVDEVATTLDLSRPVAYLLPATLNFVPDEDDPAGLLAGLLGRVVSGSYLVLAHTSPSVASARMAEAAERFGRLVAEPYVLRSRDEIARFFDGLELVDPGMVAVEEWRPPPPPATEGCEDGEGSGAGGARRRPVPIYGAVARKP